ncbi:hypothetical protein ASE86_12290 [Sphingomonas sp. Leaf33]|uniref:ShlB/FhaC/HecB family hemolysin secretion/activation protein n=1 Tax=Sphingomonas sp. Leaf33 TaxID=1736215 RepID=UPI0006F3CCD7|nr:ShlB/FhaC/HecB family hemolysin secretion/activation protein [Sphingomonas sp. Leaf33]KQN19284.1 hypothetical protein ASE86_12290 [Sphingomonas sp. Leaf33]
MERLLRRHLIAAAVSVTLPMVAHGQATAPSSITPPNLRPPVTGGDAPPELPAPGGLTPPPGSEGLSVRIAAVRVDGALPAVAAAAHAIADRLAGRTVTLAEIYAAAGAIEAAHIRRGYIFVRATVPPQEIAAGGTVVIRIVNGFIERIDVDRLPTRLRAPVLRRAGMLAGQRGLTLAAIERPLLIAGDVPGLTIASTLARGETEGGTQLILTGRYRPVTGSLSADNSLNPSLGRVALTGQISLNSLLGLGEQIYGFAVTGYDLPRAFRADAPVRVLSGGGIIGIGDARLTLNPEATFSRTQPEPVPGVPRIRGTLRRLTLRGGYVLSRSRRGALTAGLTVERIREANTAIDFATAISIDDFSVARAQVAWNSAIGNGGAASLVAQLSEGLGRRADDAAPVSRQGAVGGFTKLAVTARLLRPMSPRLALSATARAQLPFGQALFRSEQAQLEGSDALSSYIGGVTAVDGSATLRAEVTRAPRPTGWLRVSPYVFGAVGQGWFSRPTAVEAGSYTLFNPGVGARASFASGRINASAEYGHGFSRLDRLNGVDRLALSLSVTL